MKATFAGLLALALSAAPMAAQAAGGPYDMGRLTPLTLSYRVLAQGNQVAAQRVFIVREGGGWVRTDSVEFGPVKQVLRSGWSADFTATSHQESFSGGMTGEATIQVAAGRVTGQANLPEQAGGQRTYDAPAVAGMVFEGQDHAALAVADLQPGRSYTFPIFKVNTGSMGIHTYDVGAVETVTVPAGTFPAYRVVMTGEQVPMTIWLRQEGLHIPLKFEVQGAPFVVELQ